MSKDQFDGFGTTLLVPSLQHTRVFGNGIVGTTLLLTGPFTERNQRQAMELRGQVRSQMEFGNEELAAKRAGLSGPGFFAIDRWGLF